MKLASIWAEVPPPCEGDGVERWQWHRRRQTAALLYAFSRGRLKCDPERGIIFNSFGDPMFTTQDTYPRFFFKINNTKFGAFVHKAVWVYVNGAIPEGYEINHVDRDTKNACIANLELVSKELNLQLRDEARALELVSVGF